MPFSTKNQCISLNLKSKAKLLNGIKQSHKVCTIYVDNVKILVGCILLVHCGRKKMISVNVEAYDIEI